MDLARIFQKKRMMMKKQKTFMKKITMTYCWLVRKITKIKIRIKIMSNFMLMKGEIKRKAMCSKDYRLKKRSNFRKKFRLPKIIKKNLYLIKFSVKILALSFQNKINSEFLHTKLFKIHYLII